MKLAMKSIALTASACASASEAAFLVASFMPYSPTNGHDSSLRESACDGQIYTRNTPRRVFALTSPHSANIDSLRLE